MDRLISGYREGATEMKFSIYRRLIYASGISSLIEFKIYAHTWKMSKLKMRAKLKSLIHREIME